MSTMDRERPPLLLVHGFWHGAWAWEQVALRLAAAGRRAVAVDMAGHGLDARRPASATARPFDEQAFATEVSPVSGVDLDGAAAQLLGQVRALAADGTVVLVAHSFSGPVITRVVQDAPHLVAHVVYVAAVMPASGVVPATYLSQPEQEGDLIATLLRADPQAVGALRLDTAGPSGYRSSLREAFYPDVEPATADAATALLAPDAPVAITAAATDLTASGWGSVPRTYVLTGEADCCIRPLLQRRFVREADEAFPDEPTSVVELGGGHSPFLSRPDELAAILAAVR